MVNNYEDRIGAIQPLCLPANKVTINATPKSI